jgi:hypothetical protein
MRSVPFAWIRCAPLPQISLRAGGHRCAKQRRADQLRARAFGFWLNSDCTCGILNGAHHWAQLNVCEATNDWLFLCEKPGAKCISQRREHCRAGARACQSANNHARKPFCSRLSNRVGQTLNEFHFFVGKGSFRAGSVRGMGLSTIKEDQLDERMKD